MQKKSGGIRRTSQVPGYITGKWIVSFPGLGNQGGGASFE